MSFFQKIAELFRAAFTRKKREEEWASRFTNPPARTETPMDPKDPRIT
jgi:hypothetical protein